MMSRFSPLALPVILAAGLAGCVERGGWKPAPRLEPQALAAQQALAGTKVDAAAWPAEGKVLLSDWRPAQALGQAGRPSPETRTSCCRPSPRLASSCRIRSKSDGRNHLKES